MILTLEQPAENIVHRYYKQYVHNHQGLNMEFTEFMANKLQVSEADAVKVIKNWKQEKEINVVR